VIEVTAALAVADSQTAPAPVKITPQPNETNELANDSAPKEITHLPEAAPEMPASNAVQENGTCPQWRRGIS
jgi:hypothetical protein